MMEYPFLKKANSPFIDRYVKKAAELLEPWNGIESSQVGLIGVPLSKSSISHSGALMAPATIRKEFGAYSTYSIEENLDLALLSITDFGDIDMHVTDIKMSQDRIEQTLTDILTDYPDMFPIILGGDHSISFPAISAIMKTKGRVGVIQFDAHHDLRNLVDGGPSNGTPFRSLIEHDVISGDQLVQIGIRDFSNSAIYSSFAYSNQVTVYTMKDVRKQPITTILEQAIEQLIPLVDCLYLSIDIDVLDQAFAPGCPAIGPGGMDSQTLLDAAFYLGQHPLIKGLDIVEIDPTVDFRNMTSRVGVHVILQFLKGRMAGGLL